MASNKYSLYCCGSRGSWPVEGHIFNEFGGYTSCYVLKKDDYALVIDCGTGFYSAISLFKGCKKVDVVLTHMHYDHILGLLKWTAIPEDLDLTFYASASLWEGEPTFNRFFAEPFWPVRPKFNLKTAPSYGIPLKLEEDTYVRFYKADHPSKASLLIVEYNDNKLVMMCDNESSNSLDFDLINKCNILIYDGMYTDEEYKNRKGFGHSTWQEGVRLAQKVNSDRLIITHHNPNREDNDLLEYEAKAREEYPFTDFARAGQKWSFPLIREDIAIKQEEEHYTLFDDINVFFQKVLKKFDSIISDEKQLRSYIQMNAYLIMFAVSTFMTIVNIITGKTLLLFSTLLFAIVSLADILLVKYLHVRSDIVEVLFIVEAIVLCTFFIVSGTPEGFSILWCLLLPTAGMLVFGKKRTIISCSIMFLIIIFFFWTEVGQTFLMYNYNDSYRLRFPMAFVAFFALSLFLDFVRTRTLKVLDDNKKKQETQISIQTQALRDQNFNLSEFNTQLEMRNRLLNKTFGRNLPDELVKNYLEDSNDYNINGEKVVASMLKVEIHNYLKSTRDLGAQEKVIVLNKYLSKILDIILKNKGAIIEFKESGVYAHFSKVSKHAELALCSAIEIHSFIKEMDDSLIDVSTIIHTGDIVLGTIGNQERCLKYDALGDNVKMAYTLISEVSPNEIVISEDTLRSLTSTVHIKDVRNVSYEDKLIELYVVDGIGDPYNMSC